VVLELEVENKMKIDFVQKYQQEPWNILNVKYFEPRILEMLRRSDLTYIQGQAGKNFLEKIA
jgi:hypothetical protein